MSLFATNLKRILLIKFKHRHDSLSDQYNRLFVMKMILACTLISGLNWFKDPLNCIVPAISSIDTSFVTTACWIQGLYVYKALINRTVDSSYYGISKDIDIDGISRTGSVCATIEKVINNSTDCVAMEKFFFLQYQWIPFSLAAISLLYYIPYLVFLSVNSDLVSLNKSLNDGHDSKWIAIYYFKKHNACTMFFKVILNLSIKILYVATNIGTFALFDYMLNGSFRYFGYKWIIWARSNDNNIYKGVNNFRKPGNELFPPFGYCELYESTKDIKHSVVNKHKFVCELSQHILYQYCFLIIWFLVICGAVISVFGFFIQIFQYFRLLVRRCYLRDPPTKKLLNSLNLYELVYLQRIESKDRHLYIEVIEELKRLAYI